VHGRNGVCDFTVANDVDAIFLARQLLTYLPASAGEHLPLADPLDPAGEEDPGDVVPLSGRKVYDVRAVIDSIADAGSVLEASPKWAPNIVTAFARIEGGPVGIVANQPRYLGGVIDVAASQKGASFIRTCNQYGVPLVALVDTPGFLPGSSQESAGVIRHGATLLHAFAASTVPRFTVVLRKAFGGAYITMNSKDLGADLYLAWNRAELGIMGAEQAVGVVHRRALAAAPDPGEERRRLADEYAVEHLSARAAARTGAVDEIIEPSETRTRLAWALSTMTRSYQPARLRAAG
jgi:acetyl-CoA carboxylase carboxyltransferase component